MSAALHTLVRGSTPLFISVPHAGTYIPPELRADMTPIAQTVPDTDWHVHLLYEFALQAGAGMMVATHSRYVVDLNRPPDGASLYPGMENTGLCPAKSFAGAELYLPGRAPDDGKIAVRRDNFWSPYHNQLAQELATLKRQHGHAVLLDAHSILKHVPRLFEGSLPDLNLGTAGGNSCAPTLEAQVRDVLATARGFSSVLNGRFKGGYITRHFGKPADGIHALQLEIAQAAYMDERPPYAWNPVQARPLIEVLRNMVSTLLSWRPL
jgi:N-formylglutamate deformylase